MIQQKGDWFFIPRKTPPEGIPVLCYDETMGMYVDTYMGKITNIMQFKKYPIPSHWMFLPEPPKRKKLCSAYTKNIYNGPAQAVTPGSGYPACCFAW